MQPLNFTISTFFKKFQKRVFSEYFTTCMMEVQQIDPDRDVINIEVHLCLSALKHRYAKVMTELYYNIFFQEEKR